MNNLGINKINVSFFIAEGSLYINKFNHCNTEWDSINDYIVNDRCPMCDRQIMPYESEDKTIREVTEEEFLEAHGVIEYQRLAGFGSSASEILLIKSLLE